MNIGIVSKRSGLPAKTIRYYEDIGLVCPLRGENGYRDFSAHDLVKLSFVGRARSVGFSIEECRMLLSLYQKKQRTSSEVKAVAEKHLVSIEAKIREMQEMSGMLRDLVARCNVVTTTITPSVLSWTDLRVQHEARYRPVT